MRKTLAGLVLVAMVPAAALYGETAEDKTPWWKQRKIVNCGDSNRPVSERKRGDRSCHRGHRLTFYFPVDGLS